MNNSYSRIKEKTESKPLKALAKIRAWMILCVIAADMKKWEARLLTEKKEGLQKLIEFYERIDYTVFEEDTDFYKDLFEVSDDRPSSYDIGFLDNCPEYGGWKIKRIRLNREKWESFVSKWIPGGLQRGDNEFIEFSKKLWAKDLKKLRNFALLVNKILSYSEDDFRAYGIDPGSKSWPDSVYLLCLTTNRDNQRPIKETSGEKVLNPHEKDLVFDPRSYLSIRFLRYLFKDWGKSVKIYDSARNDSALDKIAFTIWEMENKETLLVMSNLIKALKTVNSGSGKCNLGWVVNLGCPFSNDIVNAIEDAEGRGKDYDVGRTSLLGGEDDIYPPENSIFLKIPGESGSLDSAWCFSSLPVWAMNVNSESSLYSKNEKKSVRDYLGYLCKLSLGMDTVCIKVNNAMLDEEESLKVKNWFALTIAIFRYLVENNGQLSVHGVLADKAPFSQIISQRDQAIVERAYYAAIGAYESMLAELGLYEVPEVKGSYNVAVIIKELSSYLDSEKKKPKEKQGVFKIKIYEKIIGLLSSGKNGNCSLETLVQAFMLCSSYEINPMLNEKRGFCVGYNGGEAVRRISNACERLCGMIKNMTYGTSAQLAVVGGRGPQPLRTFNGVSSGDLSRANGKEDETPSNGFPFSL